MSKKILIVGPCAAESAAQMRAVSCGLKDVLQADMLQSFEPVFRAGLWKPRSQPVSFQGVGGEGLPWLL